MAEFIAVSSESDSGEEMDTLMLLYLTSKRQNSVWRSEYMKKRKTHGEFALTSEFSVKHLIIIIIIIIIINCNWVVTWWQWLIYMYTNIYIKKVTRKFKSGGLPERHVVATWKLGNHLSIRL